MKKMKTFYASLSEDNKLLLRVTLSCIRTLIAFELFKLAVVMTDSHAIFDFLSSFGVANYISFVIYMFSALLGSIIGLIGIFAISPLGWLILVGILRQECGISYRPVQKVFRNLRKIFLW